MATDLLSRRQTVDPCGTVWPFAAPSVTETALRLGCERGTLSRLLNGRAGVSASMARALEDIGWGTAEHWTAGDMGRTLRIPVNPSSESGGIPLPCATPEARGLSPAQLRSVVTP